MSAVITLSIAIAAIVYGFASLRIWQTLQLAGDEPDAFASGDDTTLSRRHHTLGIATVALLLHSWIVYGATGMPDTVQLPFFTSLIAVSMVIVLLHIAICLRQPASYIGIAIYPLAAVTLITWLLFGQDEAALSTQTPVQMHIFLSLLSYAVLTLAALQSVLVAIQRHLLKDHQAGGMVRALPPLDTTEELLFTLLGVGFLLLTLALATGFMHLDNMFAQHVAHKTILSTLAWLIFGLLLIGRWRFGWRGNRAIRLTLAGFVVLILAFFGSKFVFEVLLGRG